MKGKTPENMSGSGSLQNRSFVQLRPLMGAAAVHWGFDSGRGDSAEFAVFRVITAVSTSSLLLRWIHACLSV